MKNKIFIGCSGFSGRDWKGFFYPEDLPSKEQLTFYATKFSTVEINSTFYRKPRRQTIQNWYNLTSPDFKFFIKIPKTISHIKKLEETRNDVSEFCRYIAYDLNEKLAGFLFQLPPSFHYSGENLLKVLETVDPQFLNVVEFRHESWWRDDVLETLKNNDIVFAGVSYPKNISDERLSGKGEAYPRRISRVGCQALATLNARLRDRKEILNQTFRIDFKYIAFFSADVPQVLLKNT